MRPVAYLFKFVLYYFKNGEMLCLSEGVLLCVVSFLYSVA